MSVELKKLDGGKKELTFKVGSDEFNQQIDILFAKNAKTLNVKGFRKGKAPMNIIRKFYNDDIFYPNVTEYFYKKEYGNYVKANDITILSMPELNIVQIGKDKDFIFTAAFVSELEFELGDYKNLGLTKEEIVLTDKDIEDELQMERNKNARTISIDERPVEDKDIVDIDFEGFIDGEPLEGGKGINQELTIGSGQFIPRFEEQLIGHSIDEVFDIIVTFPEDYQVETIKGKEAKFTVKINNIKEKILPEIDDDFIRDISEYETLEEYKENVSMKLLQRKQQQADIKLENTMIEKIIEVSKFDIPEKLLNYQVNLTIEQLRSRISKMGYSLEEYITAIGKDVDGFIDEIRPQADIAIKTKLIIEKIFELEKLELSEQDYNNKYEEMAEIYNISVDEVKGRILANNSLQELTDSLKKIKILNLLIK